MQINVFNVEHGFCAQVVSDNGNVTLIDCGYNLQTEFRPSRSFRATGCTGIEDLIIGNFDEDHIGALPGLRQFPIRVPTKNPSVSPDILRHLKASSGPNTLAPGRV